MKNKIKNPQVGGNYEIFISCQDSKYDRKIGLKLCSVLMAYRLPSNIAKDRHGVRSVFFCAGADTDESIEALKHSDNLIVVCSDESLRKKEAVNERIRKYKESGGNNIFLLVTEGEPNDYINALMTDMKEPLAANISAAGYRKSIRRLKDEKLRILAPIFHLEYDDLKQRHRERLLRQTIKAFMFLSSIFIIMGFTGTYLWVHTNIAVNKAEKARQIAECQTEIAKRQYEISSEAIYNIQVKAGESFRDNPDMNRKVQKALNEIINELKPIKGFDSVLEELIVNSGD